ncbi:MAG: ABC transporter transmembrane domain-containing protein, partial [Armatimonadetes bacterium]|nr:ABC transporter transmembrane domain-containing protein [Armatimonadota bacterium]
LVIGPRSFAGTGFSVHVFGHDVGREMMSLVGSGDRVTLLIVLSVISVLVVFVKCAFQARQGYLMQKFGFLIARDLRQKLFNHLLSLSPAQFERESTGGLLSRLTGDVVVLQQSIGPQISEVIQSPLTITIALSLMFALNWKLTIVVLCLTPLITGLIVMAGRKIKKLITLTQDRLAELNGYLAELLSSVHVIQSFTSAWASAGSRCCAAAWPPKHSYCSSL